MESAAKTKRKQGMIILSVVGGFIGLMVFGMWLTDPNKGKPTPMEIRAEKQKEIKKDFTANSSNAITAEETWITMNESRLEGLQRKNKELEDEMAELRALIKGNASKSAQEQAPAIFPGMGSSASLDDPPSEINLEAALPPPPNFKKAQSPEKDGVANFIANKVISENLPPPPSPSISGGANGAPLNNANDQTEYIEVLDLTEPDKGDEDIKNVRNYLQAGSFATVVLMSGMDAPTGGQAQSNPVPVLLRVMDDGTLPNYFEHNMDRCHIVGASYGDIASERAHIRLETLSCTLLNGDVIQEPIKGYVAGEDGKAGMRGRVVRKEGSLIAMSLLAGFASGMSTSLTEQYSQVSTSALGQVTTVDPDKLVANGLAQGSANALEKVADFYIERANEIYPIIEVDANRIGEVVLTDGTELKRSLLDNTRDKG